MRLGHAVPILALAFFFAGGTLLVPDAVFAQEEDCHYCKESQTFPGGYLQHRFPGDGGDPSHRVFDPHSEDIRGACSYWHTECGIIEQEEEEDLIEDMIAFSQKLEGLSESAILKRLERYAGVVTYEPHRKALQVVACEQDAVVIHVPLGAASGQ